MVINTSKYLNVVPQTNVQKFFLNTQLLILLYLKPRYSFNGVLTHMIEQKVLGPLCEDAQAHSSTIVGRYFSHKLTSGSKSGIKGFKLSLGSENV